MKEKENQLELDQDGRTEEEFLARYDVDDYHESGYPSAHQGYARGCGENPGSV